MENRRIFRNFLQFIILLLAYKTSFSVTLVYNLKIRRISNLSFNRDSVNNLNINTDNADDQLNNESRNYSVSLRAAPIIYLRDRHIVTDTSILNDTRTAVGSLFSLSYTYKKKFWIEITTAVENEKVKSRSSTIASQSFNISRTGLDSIVLESGYNHSITDKSQVVFWGLVGFPTNRKVTVFDIADSTVGTRFFALGFGGEFSYSFIDKIERSLIFIFQNRFIHFFDRAWSPILPVGSKIRPGNVTDALFALRFREKKNIFEAGYDATFFTNYGAILNDDFVSGPNFLRNGFYMSYGRVIQNLKLINKPGLIGCGFSVAREKIYKTKIFDFAVSLAVNF